MNRIELELERLRTRWPDLEYRPGGQWVRIPSYPLPPGWSRPSIPVVFQVPAGFPGTPPYGIYVSPGLTFNGQSPGTSVPSQPPFEGQWVIISWTPDDGQWHATADPASGSNLLNWVVGFSQRFREGA